MTYRVVLQPRAEREIRNAARWVFTESRSQATALRWVRTIRARIETLKKSPRRCPVDPDSTVGQSGLSPLGGATGKPVTNKFKRHLEFTSGHFAARQLSASPGRLHGTVSFCAKRALIKQRIPEGR
jgi:plasmid stabilization system protein ParE